MTVTSYMLQVPRGKLGVERGKLTDNDSLQLLMTGYKLQVLGGIWELRVGQWELAQAFICPVEIALNKGKAVQVCDATM